MPGYSEIISASGNTDVPAYLAIKSLGAEITREMRDEEAEWWIAVLYGCRFIAEGPLELLGLITMRRERGSNWKASDEQIEAFIETYYPE